MLCCCCTEDSNLKVPILQAEMSDSSEKKSGINDKTIVPNEDQKQAEVEGLLVTKDSKMANIESQIIPGSEVGPMPENKPAIPIKIIDEEKLLDEHMAGKPKLSKGLSKEEIDELYYKAEFACMDLAKDGKLCYSEFVKLLVGCGYHLGVPGAKNVWKEAGKHDTSYLSEDEYVHLMRTDKELERATSGCRSVFAAFDWDCSGWASKSDIIKGLETHLGITVTPELEKKIQSMDSNKDGCIYYGDYLKMQLKGFK